MPNKPYISLIVPVYKTERYLRHCLDTLVYQTFQDIEIIIVNDGSPDKSHEIISDYVERFPSIVRGYTIKNSGLSGAREYGLKHAQGEYIYFVDSDDYLDYRACEFLASEAQSNHCDMVFTPIKRIPLHGESVVYNVISGEHTKENALKYATCSMTAAMYRRDFFLRFCPIPSMWYEDMAFTRTVLSYAESIRYIKQPTYYYIEHEDTITSRIFDERSLDSIDAVNRILNTCNPTYIDYVAYKAAQRITIDVRERWPFADAYIANAKSQRRYFDTNPLLTSRESIHKDIKELLELPDDPMPRKIYIGAFGKKPSQEFLDMVESKAFWGGCEIELLSEENCDIAHSHFLQKAFQESKFRYINHYFAIRRIVETGGIYIEESVRLDSQLNCLRYYNAFFGFLTNQSFSESIFGGRKGSRIFQYLLDTYSENFYENPYLPLAQRVCNILVAQANIQLNGKTQVMKNLVTVFSPMVFVLPGTNGFHLATHIWEDTAPSLLNSILLSFLHDYKESSPFFSSDRYNSNIEGNIENASAKGVKDPKVEAELKKAKQQIAKLKLEIEQIKSTFSWRITAPLRSIRRLIGNREGK